MNSSLLRFFSLSFSLCALSSRGLTAGALSLGSGASMGPCCRICCSAFSFRSSATLSSLLRGCGRLMRRNGFALAAPLAAAVATVASPARSERAVAAAGAVELAAVDCRTTTTFCDGAADEAAAEKTVEATAFPPTLPASAFSASCSRSFSADGLTALRSLAASTLSASCSFSASADGLPGLLAIILLTPAAGTIPPGIPIPTPPPPPPVSPNLNSPPRSALDLFSPTLLPAVRRYSAATWKSQ